MKHESTTKTKHTPATVTTMPDKLISTFEALQQECKTWKADSARTNAALYELLSKCYALYKELSNDVKIEELRAVFKQDSENGGPPRRIRKNTGKLSLILRHVFNAKRKTISAYNRALLVAEKRGIVPDKLPAFIKEAGGLEHLRLESPNKRPTTDALALTARSLLSDAAAVATVSASKGLEQLWDSSAGDEWAVLVSKRSADGSFSVVRVLQDRRVVSTALSKCTNTATASGLDVGAAERQQQRRALAVQKAAA